MHILKPSLRAGWHFPLDFHDESFFGGEHVQVRMPKWPLKPWFSWRRNLGKQNLQNWCLGDPNEMTKLVQQSSSWDGNNGVFCAFETDERCMA